MLEEKLEESVYVPSGIVKVHMDFGGSYRGRSFDRRGNQARIVIPEPLVITLKTRQEVDKEREIKFYYRTIHPREHPNYLELTDYLSGVGEEDFELYYPTFGLKDKKNRFLLPLEHLMHTGIELYQEVVFVGRENRILVYKF